MHALFSDSDVSDPFDSSNSFNQTPTDIFDFNNAQSNNHASINIPDADVSSIDFQKSAEAFTSEFKPEFKQNQQTPEAILHTVLSALNAHQSSAVLTQAPHTLILAGAGSGKTRVLTSRMVYLMLTGAASINEMMAVTFTNKAAKEMQHRLQETLGSRHPHAYIGTFHGLCHRFLRIHHLAAHLPASFQILDMQDQQSLIKKIYKEHQISDANYPIKSTIQFINQAKERGERAGNMTVSYAQQAGLLQIYQLYERTCQQLGVLDFAELLLRCDELFTEHPDICMQYQQRFKHILIDEFQDTNVLQYRWLQRFANNTPAHFTHFFAVGDDDQSIYSFRGARVSNMHDFSKNFSAELIKLEQNYRSDAPILQCANTLIRHNEFRLGKELFTEKQCGEPVVIHHAFNEDAEALKVVEHIKNLAAKQVKLTEMAILYRSNAQSRVFEHVFFQHQIPYKVYGGLRFFERSEVKHAIAYLQLIDDMHNIPAFARVVNVPARGIGTKTIEGLQAYASLHQLSFYQAAVNQGGKVLQFTHLIDALSFKAQGLTLSELITHVLENTGLLALYMQEKDSEGRVDNLKELVSAAQSFAREQGYQATHATQVVHNGEFSTTPLRHFLSFSALEGTDTNEEQQPCVQMMSIHASKGLEFDHVFLTGLEDGLFPSYASSQNNEVEEERRLMYVAITRARKGLRISLAESRMLYGTTSYNKPSRFLDELPEGATIWMPPKRKKTYGGSYSQKNTYDAKSTHASTYHGYERAHTSDYEISREVMTSPAEKKAQSTYYKKLNANKKLSITQTSQDSADADSIKPAVQTYRIGQTVFSNKFGEGKIENIQGHDASAILSIAFKRYGVRHLQLNLAKLQIID